MGRIRRIRMHETRRRLLPLLPMRVKTVLRTTVAATIMIANVIIEPFH